jgi:hypothetical protein
VDSFSSGLPEPGTSSLRHGGTEFVLLGKRRGDQSRDANREQRREVALSLNRYLPGFFRFVRGSLAGVDVL